MLRILKKILPEKMYGKVAPLYHYFMAWFAAVRHGHPSRKIKVIFITGTKGKSSTTEILASMLEAAGKKVASAGTIQFKIADKVTPNKFKMTVQGRGFLQKFLREAVDAGCEYAVLEMTSGAVLQYRHKFIDPDCLIFLNISPEHIEQHGSFENYLAAKLELAKALEKSPKQNKLLIANGDDKHSKHFLNAFSGEKKTFSLKEAQPFTLDHYGLYIMYKGKNLRSHLQGQFNIYNILAALTYATHEKTPLDAVQRGLDSLKGIAGRVQKIRLPDSHPLSKKQDFTVVVDYAHTADSLEKMYEVFKDSLRVGVLGNTGGGRDTWKRPEMAKVANENCTYIILTNEDPYDEDPMKIISDMTPAITSTPYEVIMDRREAINRALVKAVELRKEHSKADVTVIISGKGTDPYIMLANGKKLPWSDAKVAEEELEKVLRS